MALFAASLFVGITGLKTVRHARAATASMDQFASALRIRDERVAAWKTQVLSTVERQRATLKRIEAATVPSACDTSTPVYGFGVGTLQVASVPTSRGADVEQFTANQVSRLRMLLDRRGMKDWGRSLGRYSGLGKVPIERVVFHNVGPGSGAQMCAWLRCENWTGGCGFINERGRTHVEDNPTAPPKEGEYPPAEDMYQQWKTARLAGADGLPPL